MNTEVMIKILMSESSTEAETKLIQEELQTLLHRQGLNPTSIACRNGSTEVIIKFVVESVAKGALGAIGALFFSFVRSKILANTQTTDPEILISQSQQDYNKMLEITPNNSDKAPLEVMIDEELIITDKNMRSDNVRYTMTITEISKDDASKTVTQFDYNFVDGKLKDSMKTESKSFE